MRPVLYSASPTIVPAGQIPEFLLGDAQGKIVVRPWSVPDLEWTFAAPAGGFVNTSDNVIAAAAGAGLRRYVTGMQLANGSATATDVQVKDGSTVIWRGFVPANMAQIEITFPTPLRTSANTALNIACGTTASAIYANVQGFTAP